MVFASEDEEPRNAKEKGVEDVDDRVDDVQVREAENSEGVTFVETRSDGYEGDTQENRVNKHGEL